MSKSTAGMHSVARTFCRGGPSLVQRISSNLLVHPCLHRGHIKPVLSPSTVRCNSSSTWPPQMGSPYHLKGAPDSPPDWYDPKKDRLFILDAMGPIFRIDGGYGDTRLKAPTGEDTTILFGFLKFFLGVLSSQPMPAHVVAVFDAPGATFRNDIVAKDLWHPDNIAEFIQNRTRQSAKNYPYALSPNAREEMYPAYKGNRVKVNDRVYEGSRKVMEWLESLGIKCLQVHGVEADDVCGTIACRAIDDGMSIFLFSPDKDYFQLLRDNLLLFRGPAQREFQLHTAERFSKEHKGLVPKQFVEVAGLCGDASDNIPGVYGIGEKTALDLVLQHMDVEGVVEAAKTGSLNLKGKRGEKLLTEDGWNAARKSRQLVEIQTQLKMPDVRFNFEEARLGKPPNDTAFEKLSELGIVEPVPRLKQLVAQWQ